jgi:hypothetical protein
MIKSSNIAWEYALGLSAFNSMNIREFLFTLQLLAVCKGLHNRVVPAGNDLRISNSVLSSTQKKSCYPWRARGGYVQAYCFLRAREFQCNTCQVDIPIRTRQSY